MSHNVDIDEADVAVLNQNLVKSKELFSSVSSSLNNISRKSATASAKIKPVLRDVNKLNTNKQQIEAGLEMLSEVSSYASRASQYESILNNSIELIGLKKFLDTLVKSKKLLKEMKVQIPQFQGILINFDNLVEKSQMIIVNYFTKIITKMDLVNSNLSLKTNQDIYLIINYFYNKSGQERDMINGVFVTTSSKQILALVKPYTASCQPSKNKQTGAPYDKGTNGINIYVSEAMKAVDTIVMLLNDMVFNLPNFDELAKDQLLKSVLSDLINGEMSQLLEMYNSQLTGQLLDNDILILEVIERMLEFEHKLNVNNLVIGQFPRFKNNFNQFLTNSQEIFRTIVGHFESRISKVEKFNERSMPEVIVELISRERKLSDFNQALLTLIDGLKLGSWLNLKPPVKFISVYTSVIPITPESGIDENSCEFLLSSFYSDLIDAIMINIEIGLKNNSGDASMKKSTQGFHLIKNSILIESIIRRSQQLFSSLGSIGTERLNKLKNRFLKLFLDDWNYASYIIIRDMTAITTTSAMNQSSSSSGFSNKEREQIKELFRNFNESFEEALRNYEKFSITDQSLRNYLKSEIKKLIINAYFKLYDKYGKADFTKNKQKYVKYDKSQFENLLNQKL